MLIWYTLGSSLGREFVGVTTGNDRRNMLGGEVGEREGWDGDVFEVEFCAASCKEEEGLLQKGCGRLRRSC